MRCSFNRSTEKRIFGRPPSAALRKIIMEAQLDCHKRITKTLFAAQKLWSYSRMRGKPAFDFIPQSFWTPCASAPRSPTRVQKQSGVRSASGGAGDVSQVRADAALSRCAGVGRAEMSVCIYRRPKAPSAASTSRALPLVCAHRTMCCRPSGNRGVEECAAAAGLSAYSRSGNADVCGASACAAACRSPMRRPLRRTERRLALFFARRRKGVIPCSTAYGIPLCARYAPKSRLRGRSLRLCAGRYGIACRRSARRRPTAKPKRPDADSAQTLCAFRRNVWETARQKAAKRFSLRTKKRLRRAAADAYCSPVFFASR